ncbi:hypothetical protein ACIOEX_03315 [Streptomyces sp. NPDC087850]|uniref:hypothetical protein n=1 Tax=Streptomyces sp. NPDC087850 TaxID=3365809 RepID=UPI003809B3DF
MVEMNVEEHRNQAHRAAGDADELHALIAAGGFWRLAPDWVPRTGYTGVPGAEGLRRIADGLLALSVPGPGETW